VLRGIERTPPTLSSPTWANDDDAANALARRIARATAGSFTKLQGNPAEETMIAENSPQGNLNLRYQSQAQSIETNTAPHY
jgi:hypothetical protein